jgi:ABC-2 type transport system permease protein
MSWILFGKILRDIRWPFLGICVLLTAFEMLWAKITQRVTGELLPAFEKLGISADQIIEKVMDKEFGKFVQSLIGGENIRLYVPHDMLTIGYVHPVVQTIFAIWAVGRASGALAGEMERGTMELLLAQPIPRRTVVLTQLAIDAVTIPILCLCMILGSWIGIHVVGFSEKAYATIQLQDFWGGLVNSASLLFALSGLTMACSACGRSRWRVMAATIAIVLVSFILNVLGQLWSVLRPWRPLSLFYYYQPQPIILKNTWTVSFQTMSEPETIWLTVPMIPILVAIGFLGYGVALWVFCRRDLPAPL